jgi:hypothetical protein
MDLSREIFTINFIGKMNKKREKKRKKCKEERRMRLRMLTTSPKEKKKKKKINIFGYLTIGKRRKEKNAKEKQSK